MKNCRSMTLTLERSVGVLLFLSKRIYLTSSLMFLLFLDPTPNLDHGFFTILLRRNKAEGKIQKWRGINVFIFRWRIIALQYSVGFCHTSTWISQRYTHVPSLLYLPSASHPSRLSQNTGLSSLCHTENSHWLFILQTVMYMLQCCEFLPKVKGITALTPSVFIF